MALCKALLVGINAYQDAPLQGCINDVRQMRGLLKRIYGFPEAGIRVLVDQEATHAGIQAGLLWLAEGGDEPDAVRVFHYSGHGSYVADVNGDEPDGRDECLVPYDYQSTDMLTDDILKIFYDRIPPSGNLTLVMDSCHSGTVQRAAGTNYRFIPMPAEERERANAAAARFLQDQEDYVVNEIATLRGQDMSEEDRRAKARELTRSFEKKRFGDVRAREGNILLAACQSDQQAADAPIDGAYHGPFTYYLCQAITEAHGQITYRELAEQTGMFLDDNGYFQVPQLEYAGSRDQQLAFHPFI